MDLSLVLYSIDNSKSVSKFPTSKTDLWNRKQVESEREKQKHRNMKDKIRMLKLRRSESNKTASVPNITCLDSLPIIVFLCLHSLSACMSFQWSIRAINSLLINRCFTLISYNETYVRLRVISTT